LELIRSRFCSASKTGGYVERQPVQFLERELDVQLNRARAALAPQSWKMLMFIRASLDWLTGDGHRDGLPVPA